MLLLASSVCGLFKWRQFEPEVILLAVGSRWNDVCAGDDTARCRDGHGRSRKSPVPVPIQREHVIVGLMTISTDVDKLNETDLTDATWALIAPMLPAARPGGGPRKINIRAV